MLVFNNKCRRPKIMILLFKSLLIPIYRRIFSVLTRNRMELQKKFYFQIFNHIGVHVLGYLKYFCIAY